MSNTTKQDTTTQTARQLREPQYKKVLRIIWRLFGIGTLLVVALFTYLSFQLPSFEQLENPKINVASEIYSSDGVLLGKFFVENRTPVPYDSISPHVINALISTEDARFYSHSGIDAEALLRVVVKTMMFQDQNAGGGSTISQQLAKLLVGRPDTKGMFFLKRYWMLFTTKLKEWLTAVKLERSYTKKEILTIYLNEFDFLYNAHGIRSAAETYFGKQPIDLSINESAMLVRMLKNPSVYNFRRNMTVAMKGREVVLNNMLQKGHITKEQYNKLRVEPIDGSRFKVQDHNEGLGTYFREYLRGYLAELLTKKEFLKANGQPYDIYRDGLKIYTTINSRMQAHAEQAVWDHLSQHQQHMFKHWEHWNAPELEVSMRNQKQNPWTYMDHRNSLADIDLRLQSLYRAVWESDRYVGVRDEFMKTANKHKLREIDIYRMMRIESVDEKPFKDVVYNRTIDGKTLMEDWLKTRYITESQANQYRQMMRSADWTTIKSEYKSLIAYMQKPVKMKVFSYVKHKDKYKAGEKDTLMSPFDSLRYHRMFLQAGTVAIEPQTGYVRAWVGGIDHHYFQLDHVSMGTTYVHPAKRVPGKEYPKVGRQVGSSIKPFLYALTIDLRGYSPCYEIEDIETTIEKGYGRFGLIKDWTPQNANGKYSGERVTLIQALRLSLNSVSAQLMKDLGSTEKFRNFLVDLGVDTAKVPSSPTICLGTPDITPLEMTGGYTVFANGGVYSEPVFVERVEDKNGNPIFSAESDQIVEQVLTEGGAYAMSEILQAVQQGAPGFQGLKSRYGGKTGTTNFQSDGWFMGITPNLVVGTWVGNDDRFIRFRAMIYGQGGSMARPIFQNFLRYLESDPKSGFDVDARYPRPDDKEIELNCLKYDDKEMREDEDGVDLTRREEEDYDKPKGAKKEDKKEKKKSDLSTQER